MKEFFKKKGVGYILNIIAIAVGIIALVCYLCSAEDKSKMTETFVSAAVYVPLIIAILLNVAALFFDHSLIKIGAFVVYFAALAFWIFTQAGYIVNVMMGIDGNKFGFAYVLSVVCLVAAMALCIVSAALKKKKQAEPTSEPSQPESGETETSE